MVAIEAIKTEEKVRDYELILIINPEVAEERLSTILDSVSRFVTEKGGTNSNVDRWGKRKLAYPIKHFLEGNYVQVQFKLKPASSKELVANLRISEDILRHLLVKLES